MTKNVKLLMGLVALVLLWMLMLFFNWHRIEAELQTGSVEALDQAGYGHLAVDTDHRGRTVFLSGVMRSKEGLEHAVSLVENIEGVHQVKTDSILIKPYAPAKVSFTSNGSSITLLGAMSSGSAANQFSQQVESVMGMPLDHGISFDADVESPQWLIGLATGLPALKQVENLQFDVQDKKLRITGISREKAAHQAALGAVSNLPGIQSVDASALVFKPFNPSWFELSANAASATVRTRSDASQLQQMWSGFGGASFATDFSVNGEFSDADWLNDLARIAENAGGVESPQISYRDGVIKVSGIVRDQQAFDILAAQAPHLTHTRQLNLAELELRPFEPPWVQMQVTKDRILLQGLVSQGSTTDALLKEVESGKVAEFNGVIENQIEVSSDASPATWGAELGRLIAGITQVDDGYLILRDKVLTLSGTVREESVFNALQSNSADSELAEKVDTEKLTLRPWKDPRLAISRFDSKAVMSGRVGIQENADLLGEAFELVFGPNNATQILVDPDVTDAAWLNDVMRLMPALIGLENASLTASDQKIDIEGIARTQESYSLLEGAINDLTAKGILNQVALRPWLQPALEISASDQSLLVAGLLPDENALSRLNAQVAVLSAAFGVPVESSVNVNPDVAQADWLLPIIRTIPSLVEVKAPALKISESVMLLSGQVPFKTTLETLSSRMSVAGEELEIQNNIIVVSPVTVETGAGSIGIAQEEIDQCEESMDSLQEDRNIEFASSSAVLSFSSTPILVALINAIENCPDVVVEVSGHTDSSGNSAANLVLSDNRAKAVVDYLVAAGIPASRLEAEGYGSSQPLADNSTAQGRAANRRIEFNIKMKR